VWPFALGGVLAWLGLLVRWSSFVSLGKYFTVVLKTSEDQPVVQRGPYRFLRHPSYTGLLLVFAGLGLMLGNWVSAVGAVGLVLIALAYRIRVEERALIAAVGDRYQEFAASRARLIPYVW
jgi:protein-S-isoprenylcysteine O-methyltransferase Ste14